MLLLLILHNWIRALLIVFKLVSILKIIRWRFAIFIWARLLYLFVGFFCNQKVIQSLLVRIIVVFVEVVRFFEFAMVFINFECFSFFFLFLFFIKENLIHLFKHIVIFFNWNVIFISFFIFSFFIFIRLLILFWHFLRISFFRNITNFFHFMFIFW